MTKLAENIIDNLSRQNLWWLEEHYEIKESAYPKRDLYKKIKESLKLPQIISVLGLRRTGKSTLIRQLLANILSDSNRVCFFSFDKALLASSPDLLENVIEFYIKAVLKEAPSKLSEKVYFFFDEIQYVDYWQDVLKRYYDMNPDFKFIISGSFSNYLRMKSKESLAGRIFEYHLNPLSFNEYLRIKSANHKPFRIRENLDPLKYFDLSYRFIKTNIFKLSQQMLDYNYQFEKFLLYGEFPETLKFSDNLDIAYQYINSSVLEKVIDYDIPKIFNIDKKYELSLLAKALIQDCSSIFEIKNLAQDLGLDQETCSKYIEILEQSFILKRVYKYSKSVRKHSRSSKKVYVSSCNFMASLLELNPLNTNLMQEYLGKIVENYVSERLSAMFEYLSFYRERTNEIDFIAGKRLHKAKSQLLWIEVKYRNTLRSKDLQFFKKYLRQEDIKRGLVITKNLLKVEEEDGLKILYLPACFL